MKYFLSVLFCFVISAFAQTNVAPKVFVDGEADYLNSGAFLFCSTSDDGLVRYLTYNWTKVSGPGTITWAGQQSRMAHARFSIKGLYVLQCSVYDGQFTVTDHVTILADAYADFTTRP